MEAGYFPRWIRTVMPIKIFPYRRERLSFLVWKLVGGGHDENDGRNQWVISRAVSAIAHWMAPGVIFGI